MADAVAVYPGRSYVRAHWSVVIDSLMAGIKSSSMGRLLWAADVADIRV